VLDTPPTAENLALTAFRILDAAYRDTYGNHLRLEQVRLFETPNCWADAIRDKL
jgi:6-pyruvoyltetrahydropterin/6-carboxytetrahydropterin synthase